MTSPLVDFHRHFDLYENFPDNIGLASDAGVHALAVTTLPRAWPRNYNACSGRSVRAALGFHPQLAADHSREFNHWKEHAKDAKFIGEVGLDAGPQHYRSLDLQRSIFADILSTCTTIGGKVLSVHSTRAATQVLDMLDKLFRDPTGVVVLHWFTGGVSATKRALDMGCYFSVNAAMARTPHGRKLISTIPQTRLLTETDGPFLKTDADEDQREVLERLLGSVSEIRREDSDQLRSAVFANLERLWQ